MRQSVAQQQVAEFVMDAGHRNRKQREHGEANADHGEKEEPGNEYFSLGQFCECPRDRSQRVCALSRRKHGEHNRREHDTEEGPKFAGKLQHRVAAKNFHFREGYAIQSVSARPEPLKDNRLFCDGTRLS